MCTSFRNSRRLSQQSNLRSRRPSAKRPSASKLEITIFWSVLVTSTWSWATSMKLCHLNSENLCLSQTGSYARLSKYTKKFNQARNLIFTLMATTWKRSLKRWSSLPCGVFKANQQLLRDHMRALHSADGAKKMPYQLMKIDGQVFCPICGFTSSQQNELLMHFALLRKNGYDRAFIKSFLNLGGSSSVKSVFTRKQEQYSGTS